MTAMVQAQSLRGYRELVTDLGGNPNRLLRKAGIEPAALNQLSAFIGFESLIDLLERSAADLGCPDFGLRLAERQDIGILATLSVAMRHSTTVGEAICAALPSTCTSTTRRSPSPSTPRGGAAKPVSSSGSCQGITCGGRKQPSTASASPGAF